MSKYLKLFETTSQYNEYINGSDVVFPNVSVAKDVKYKWVMSYDGISGKEDNTFSVPKELYDEHIYLKSGNSSFKRTIGKDKNAMVYESLYIKTNK